MRRSWKSRRDHRQPARPQKRRRGDPAAFAQRAPQAQHAGLTVAVNGCCHGELDLIYDRMRDIERTQGRTFDLLICCGDFQAVRNLDDLECVSAHRAEMGTFWRYYSGERVAPYLTLFVGGNHEAANHLWELHYGGWVAPNIYYLGAAGVINFGGLRIAGLSGIWPTSSMPDAAHASRCAIYDEGRHERPPYTRTTMDSACFMRRLDAYRLSQLRQPVDVCVSHDWPRSVIRPGDPAAEPLYAGWSGRLAYQGQQLRREVEDGTFGNPATAELLAQLQPRYWLAGHMHRTVRTGVVHAAPLAAGAAAAAAAPAAGRSAAGGSSGGAAAAETAFVGLDRTSWRHPFLEVINFPDARGPKELHYDEEWLAVLRGTHHLLSLSRHTPPLPENAPAAPSNVAFVRQALAARGGSRIPHNFVRTVHTHNPSQRPQGRMPHSVPRSPQTTAFLEMLRLPYNLDHNSPVAPQQLATVAAMPTAGHAPQVGEQDVIDLTNECD